jgi:hypothetical protein
MGWGILYIPEINRYSSTGANPVCQKSVGRAVANIVSFPEIRPFKIRVNSKMRINA